MFLGEFFSEKLVIVNLKFVRKKTIFSKCVQYKFFDSVKHEFVLYSITVLIHNIFYIKL